MSITRYSPNTIWLGGPRTEIGDLAASEAITPGMLVERWNNAGVWRWRKHNTAGGNTTKSVATEMSMANKGVADNYNAGDLMEVTIGAPGTNLWMMIGSGQNIAFGDKLESAGNGMLRILAAGTPLFQALEGKPNVTQTTRIRV